MGKLSGKTALVTGGSRGIGRSIAERLARDGAHVGVHYGSNQTAAKEAVAAIEAAGGRAFALRAELGVPGDARTLWAEFDRHASGIDILVNNAGVGLYQHIEQVAEADYDRMFAINAKAPFFIVQQGLKRVREGGRIINISAGVTRVAFPTAVAYAMAKGALNALTLNLAQDLGARRITVNSVIPGAIETEMMDVVPAEEKAAMAALSVFGRLGRPTDVAGVVAFLASDDADWVTGQCVDTTGGSLIGVPCRCCPTPTASAR
jgi:3-oxoacyl-[acyl-carrier protein] reductase